MRGLGLGSKSEHQYQDVIRWRSRLQDFTVTDAKMRIIGHKTVNIKDSGTIFAQKGISEIFRLHGPPEYT